ncbi:MAG: hypothetical protein ACLQDM_08285, partial [Bradyrhizobium sp.]
SSSSTKTAVARASVCESQASPKRKENDRGQPHQPEALTMGIAEILRTLPIERRNSAPFW